MSYPYPYPPPRKSQGAGIAVGILLVIILGAYILYTDELSSTLSSVKSGYDISTTIQGLSKILPLSLADVAIQGEQICDLDLQIPTMLSNRAFFGTTMATVISDELGKKLPNIPQFLNQPEWLYIQTDEIPSPTVEWKNCYVLGTREPLTAFMSLFNGQLASEKLSLLSFGDKSKQIPLDPLLASQPPQTTFGSSIPLTITGKDNSGLYMIDKYHNAVFKRTVAIKDDLTYPVADTVRFTIENVKADNYKIEISSFLPINEKRIGEPFILQICGLKGC